MYQIRIIADKSKIDTVEPLYDIEINDVDGFCGISSFEQKPPLWKLDIFFDLEYDAVVAEISRIISSTQVTQAEIELIKIGDENWVQMSLSDLKPIKAGKFVVYGEHDKHHIKPNDIGLHIEASAAFGTGHHQTTLGCLLALDKLLRNDDINNKKLSKTKQPIKNILDIGSGTGVLAFAIGKVKSDVELFATEVDKPSVRIAKENAKMNGLSKRFNIISDASPLKISKLNNAPKQFELIFANILLPVVLKLRPEINQLIAPKGVVIISGILNWQARRVIAAYQATGFKLIDKYQIDDWSTLVLQKKPS